MYVKGKQPCLCSFIQEYIKDPSKDVREKEHETETEKGKRQRITEQQNNRRQQREKQNTKKIVTVTTSPPLNPALPTSVGMNEARIGGSRRVFWK